MIQSIAHFTVSIVALNNRQVYKKYLMKVIADIVTRAFSDPYFPVMDRAIFVFSRIEIELVNLTKYGKIRMRFRMRLRENMDHGKPAFRHF